MKSFFIQLAKWGVLLVGGVFFLVILFLWGGKTPQPSPVLWGINFSEKYAASLNLDWKETYQALLEDLPAKRVKLITHWNLLEPTKGHFTFENLDWEVREAEKNNASLILAVGMKTPRWPECHLPEWALQGTDEDRENGVITLLETVVARYKSSPAIHMWQVENEPFVAFGKCPARTSALLQKEIDTVKRLDPTRPVLVTDSGELSLWLRIAQYGDVIGTTMYRKVWLDKWGTYFTYPLTPLSYARKAWLVKTLFGKEVLGVELQAEPWGPGWPTELSDEEKDKTMDLPRMQAIFDYASRAHLKEAYLWGAEWWYYEKLRGRGEFWEEAKKLFTSSL